MNDAANMDDAIKFSEEESVAAAPLDFYLILICDDNRDVHDATKIALSGTVINNRRLLIMDAYSGAEALMMVRRGLPFDLILLDMVMEAHDSGMSVAKQIQSHFGFNKAPVIVMRTGQPGEFKDQDVVENIWFDEFMIKSLVTQQRLIEAVSKHLVPHEPEGATPL